MIVKALDNASILTANDVGVPLVRIDPGVARRVQGDAIGPLEIRVRNEDVVEAKRIRRERGVAARRARQIPMTAELGLPDRAARGVGDVQIPLPVEGDTVAHQRMTAGPVLRVTSRPGYRDSSGGEA